MKNEQKQETEKNECAAERYAGAQLAAAAETEEKTEKREGTLDDDCGGF